MKKQFVSAALALSLLATLTGCGASGSGDTASSGALDSASGSAEGDVRTVRVGTRGTLYPYTYLDDANNLTGYDIEVLRLIDEKLEDVEFEFQTMDLSACFVALDGGQLDMIANQLVHNENRDAKYDFNTIPYCYAYSYVVVRGDEDSIQSLEDLKGKTMAITPTSEANAAVQEFNETADPQISLTYFDGGSAETFNQLATGQVDATCAYPATVKRAVEDQGYDIKTVGEAFTSTATYFVFARSDENQRLIAEIDEVLQELKDDGTLSELCIQYLGEDSTEPADSAS